MFYLKIAFGNIKKNKKRSLKTIMAVGIGVIACIFAAGFINYSLIGLRESIINGGTGHFQIYKKGFSENGIDEPFDYMITKYKKLTREIISIPGIKTVSPRLSFMGMAANSEKSIMIMGTGGLPEQEKVLNSFSNIVSGKNIESENEDGIVMGKGLAEKMALSVGDSVTINLPMAEGSYNAMDVKVQGIMNAQIKELDDILVIANLGIIQKGMNIEGSIDRLIVLIKDTDNIDKIEPQIAEICRKNGLEYKTWIELAGIQFSQPKSFFGMVFNIMMAVIIIVALFSISNTMQINVFERFREIGTMRSLGTTKKQIMGIFLAEGFLMGIMGVFAGLAGGYLLAEIVNLSGGIQMPPPPGSSRGYLAYIKPQNYTIIIYSIVFVITSAAASFIPSKKAVGLGITDALRWV